MSRQCSVLQIHYYYISWQEKSVERCSVWKECLETEQAWALKGFLLSSSIPTYIQFLYSDSFTMKNIEHGCRYNFWHKETATPDKSVFPTALGRFDPNLITTPIPNGCLWSKFHAKLSANILHYVCSQKSSHALSGSTPTTSSALICQQPSRLEWMRSAVFKANPHSSD